VWLGWGGIRATGFFFHFFYAQHDSDINKSIIRSLRLLYCISTLVVCSCFDVCWSFGVAGLGWYPCNRLLYFTSSMLNMFRTLIHPSSGPCNFSIVSPHWSYVLVSMCWSLCVAGLGWYPCNRLLYFTSCMLNMFRTLIHPPSGACDFSIVSPHWSCVLVSMCVGVYVWLGWGGIRATGFSLLH